jgi:hypothetical protein
VTVGRSRPLPAREALDDAHPGLLVEGEGAGRVGGVDPQRRGRQAALAVAAEALVQQGERQAATALRRGDGELPDEPEVARRAAEGGADDLAVDGRDEAQRRVEAGALEQRGRPLLERALGLPADLAERRGDQGVHRCVVVRPSVLADLHALGPDRVRRGDVQLAAHPPEPPGHRPAAGLEQRRQERVVLGV